MTTRTAACSCGQLRLAVEGEPVRRSICHYDLPAQPDVVAVPVGAFADPSFPPPLISVYESRRYPWVTVPEPIEHHDY